MKRLYMTLSTMMALVVISCVSSASPIAIQFKNGDMTLSACTLKPCNDANDPMNQGDDCVGTDISNNYAVYPDPFAFYTSPDHPGVTLPGPERGEKCHWQVDKNFPWSANAETCILNGTYWNTGNCSTGTKKIDTDVLAAWTKAAQDGKTIQVKLPDGTVISAMLGFGHGVLDGACGDITLVKQGDNYALVMQNGARAWSYEISSPASTHLAPDNYGNTCYIPDVALLDAASRKAVLDSLN